MNYNQLYALAQEIDANTARLEQADTQARQRLVRRAITGELGTVTLSGGGELIAVELDTRMLRYTNAAALGQAVRRAVTDAEAQARTEYYKAMRGRTWTTPE